MSPPKNSIYNKMTEVTWREFYQDYLDGVDLKYTLLEPMMTFSFELDSKPVTSLFYYHQLEKVNNLGGKDAHNLMNYL